jgi:hypothetical protein
MNPVTKRMIDYIEGICAHQFYFHALPGIACTAFHQEYGDNATPVKAEIKMYCNEVLAHLREAYPYTHIDLKR